MKFIAILVLAFLSPLTFAGQPVAEKIQYLFPIDKSSWLTHESPIIVRFANIAAAQIANQENFIEVRGEKSGGITGRTVVSTDLRTMIFKPDRPYLSSEKITVTLSPRLVGETTTFLDTTISFSVAATNSIDLPLPERENSPPLRKPTATKRHAANQDGVVVLNGVSVPSDFPYIDIMINDNPDSGYIFCNYEGDRFFNLILDNNGAPLFYWIVPDSRRDFKVQENGQLTMTVRDGFGGGGYIAVDNTYTVVDTFFAPAGYTIDEHELLVLANGHYLVTAMDVQTIDMSRIVPGGNRAARVTGYHLLEMDERDNPVFIWRCWDHYDITDAEFVDLTQRNIDYLHTNSIAVDLDGNYLISPKLLNEITKIDRNTGDILWRLGGKMNQFEYINFEPFYMQHNIRVLPNGNYTLFDNGNYHTPHYSRALEFQVDEDNMTVTTIWEFRDSPDKRSQYKGNVQRLPNGNTLICWGMIGLPKLTEVRPDGSKTFEMDFENPVDCYRVFRCPWQANAAAPFLVVEPFTDKVHLLFNKFGDPDVQEYRVYGGPEAHPTTLLRTTHQPYIVLDETDFTASDVYYFRVTAVDSKGSESGFSNEERVETNFIPANQNMIANGEFVAGAALWNFNVSGAAAAQMGTGNNECHIAIAQGGSDLSAISLSQGNLTLYQGQTYSFEFDAWADQARAIDARIESANPPYTNYGDISLSLIRPGKRRFVYTFTMQNSTTHQARLVFNVGQDNNDVYLDNVVLMRTNATDVAGDPLTSRPADFILEPIYPNPFNGEAKISFSLPSESFVTIEIIDVLGRVVDALPAERIAPGRQIRQFKSASLSSGVYFCRITALAVVSGRQFQQVGRMTVLN